MRTRYANAEIRLALSNGVSLVRYATRGDSVGKVFHWRFSEVSLWSSLWRFSVEFLSGDLSVTSRLILGAHSKV